MKFLQIGTTLLSIEKLRNELFTSEHRIYSIFLQICVNFQRKLIALNVVRKFF